MLNSLDAAIADISQQKQAFVTKARVALDTAFEEIFTNFPQVIGLKIVGYTPYFNDGDVCEYGLREMEVQLKPTGPVDMTCSSWNCKNVVGQSDKFCNVCGAQQPSLEQRADIWHDRWDGEFKKNHPQLNAVIEDFYNKLRGIQDEFKEIFGDHAEVLVRMKDGKINTTVSEYEHE